jgi:hypothetical protein
MVGNPEVSKSGPESSDGLTSACWPRAKLCGLWGLETHRNANVVLAYAGTHFRRIPAPRLRGDKLRGNDVTFGAAENPGGLVGAENNC